MCKTEGSSNGVSLIEIFCQNSSEAHRTGAVVAQMPVDQIWRRGIAVAVVAATAECECPALPAPSDRHRLAYVCHVSIVMHGGAVAVAAAGREGSVGRTYSGATNYYAKFGLISHSSITQNSRERTGRMRTRIEVYGRPKKLWSRLTTVIVLNNFSGMVHYMLNILVT